jgi:hypothetical protein
VISAICRTLQHVDDTSRAPDAALRPAHEVSAERIRAARLLVALTTLGHRVTGCFFGPDRSYHEARRRFVYKTG